MTGNIVRTYPFHWLDLRNEIELKFHPTCKGQNHRDTERPRKRCYQGKVTPTENSISFSSPNIDPSNSFEGSITFP